MNPVDRGSTSSADGRFFPALLLLFVGSGCAALIYEVVWFELLRQVIGASSVSLAILLASFMGGMCVGSLAFSRRVGHRYHPLAIYAVLELGIGAIGIALLMLLPAVQFVYVSVFGYGLAGILLRAAVCLVALLPPTVLMGATLPAVARWMKSTRVGVARLGFLYMANLAGAVAGTLLAGFYLLRVHDMLVATLVAAAINAAVAGTALLLARSASAAGITAETDEELDAADAEPGTEPSDGAVLPAPDRTLIYIVIGLSGLTSLGAQVVWTRLLGLLLGATVFTFSIILAVFLIGLGIGSSIGAWGARFSARPARGLAWCQLGLAAAVPWAAFMINREIPFWYVNPDFHGHILLRYQHDLLRGLVAMLPATVLWGASFPLALAAATHESDAPDRIVGDTYAANTLGAIIGSMAFGMVLLPWVGTHGSQQYMTLLAGLAAFMLFALEGVGSTARRAVAAVLVFGFAVLMSRTVTATDPGLIAYGRYVEDWANVTEYHFVGEGRSTSVAVSDYNDGTTRSMHVGGKVVASNQPLDMRIERMLGHVPGLVHPDPKSVLVVGFGAGVTAGSFVLYPGVERIVICEIEPLVPEAAGVWFAEENYHVVDDPRVEIVFDDARHFIATTHETFDVITSDPIHPWVRGAASLYSTEYFELVKQRLNPGGVVAQWVPLYETSAETVKSEMATFFQAFPDGTVWNSDTSGEGYDVVMLGQLGPTTIDVAALADRIQSRPQIQRSLAQVDLGDAYRFLGQYLGQASDLSPWLTDAQINHDRSLRLQYLAGLSVDDYETRNIFNAIAAYRRYPDNVFIAPPQMEYGLRNSFGY
ncbi:MAG: fused MFS/spermidine synthase [Acidobacteriota bacterium]